MTFKFYKPFRKKIPQLNITEGGHEMPVIAPEKKRTFSVTTPISRTKRLSIRRVGKDILLYDRDKSIILSGENVDSIVKTIISRHENTRILTSGLSKAQVEKIAGSFVGDQSAVEVRHASRLGNNPNQLQRFEIVIKGGEVNG